MDTYHCGKLPDFKLDVSVVKREGMTLTAPPEIFWEAKISFEGVKLFDGRVNTESESAGAISHN